MANTPKHTPGPWRTSSLYGQPGDYMIWADSKDVAIGQCFRRTEAEDPAATQAANCRLIAAAPDLLAVLDGILNGATLDHNEHWTVDDSALVNARAAIAKATGNE